LSGGAAALLLALAALPGRDQAAGALLLAGALAMAVRQHGYRRALALGIALAGLASFVPASRTPLGSSAGLIAGDTAFLVFAGLLALRALREARPRPVRWVALLPPLSCAGSWLAPNVRLAILASATFTRVAVLLGVALFVYAAAARQRSLESLAFASVASCFFPGWRTLLLVLLEGWIMVSGDGLSLPGRLRGAMAPLACLALLVLFTGADLLWLGAARAGVLLTIRIEEQLVFDVVLAALLLVLAAVTALIERGAPALLEAPP